MLPKGAEIFRTCIIVAARITKPVQMSSEQHWDMLGIARHTSKNLGRRNPFERETEKMNCANNTRNRNINGYQSNKRPVHLARTETKVCARLTSMAVLCLHCGFARSVQKAMVLRETLSFSEG